MRVAYRLPQVIVNAGVTSSVNPFTAAMRNSLPKVVILLTPV